MMGGGIIFITVHMGRRNGGPRGAELDPRDRHRVEEEGEQQIEQRIRAAADVHTAILRVYIYYLSSCWVRRGGAAHTTAAKQRGSSCMREMHQMGGRRRGGRG